MDKPLNANQITAQLLLDIPKRWPDVLAWRNNTGAGVGWSIVKAAIRLLKKGNIAGAIALLNRPMKWGLVGSSDIIAVLGPSGRFLGIEVKDPETDDEQTPIQKAFELRCLHLGAGYIIAEDVNSTLAEIDLYVKGLK